MYHRGRVLAEEDPAIVVEQARHSPQPGAPSDVHCRAAAKHSAATERPDPGGPVISQAWVIVAVEPPVPPATPASL